MTYMPWGNITPFWFRFGDFQAFTQLSYMICISLSNDSKSLADRFHGSTKITCSQPLSVLVLAHSSQKTFFGIGLGRGASDSNIGEVWYGTIRDAHNPY